ncbi:uncharacterized protein LOC143470262 isoform X1 [Clavelina lepadiformis]|uniref:uncharacterized protein LOC143470262 isoform X1 n=1 Tax=Clavelina lepadiformis TaxID=159417 RepID=UPI00404182D9
MDQEEEPGDFQLTHNPSHGNVENRNQSQPIDAAQEEQHRHVEGRLQEMDLQDEGSQPVTRTEDVESQQLAIARQEVAQIVRELASSGERTIQGTPQNIAEPPGPSQAPVQEPTIQGTPQNIAELPGPSQAPVQGAAQPEPSRQRHFQDRETGGWHETIRQTEIKAFGFTIKGIPAITLAGGATTIALIASLRDPVTRQTLVSAFAAGAAG